MPVVQSILDIRQIFKLGDLLFRAGQDSVQGEARNTAAAPTTIQGRLVAAGPGALSSLPHPADLVLARYQGPLWEEYLEIMEIIRQEGRCQDPDVE